MAIQHDGWSIVAQYRKCGKEECKTCAEGYGHGPYYYGTRLVNGRRKIRYFGKSLPPQKSDVQTNTVAELQQEIAALRRENEELHNLVMQLQEGQRKAQLERVDPQYDRIQQQYSQLSVGKLRELERKMQTSVELGNSYGWGMSFRDLQTHLKVVRELIMVNVE